MRKICIFNPVNIVKMEGVTSMDQVIVRKLTEIIHANLDKENFGISELAVAAGMSRSSVHRRLKAYMNKSGTQFIREVRLHKAMEMLQQDMDTASEISYKVGFNSPTYFNYCFHHYYGFPPGEVKKRFFADAELKNGGLTTGIPPISPELPGLAIKSGQFFRFSRRKVYVASLIALIFFSVMIYFDISFFRNSRNFNVRPLAATDKSIVVLPFENLSENSDNQYFAKGITDDVLNHLYRIREFKVISHSTVEFYRKSPVTVKEIAKKLKVNFILEGSVQRYEGNVRVIVQLIDARIDRQIWSEKYDRQLADVFIIQSDIASQIAGELQTVLTSNEIDHINEVPTKNPEAYNLYLKGRFSLNKMTREGLKKGIDFFEMALAADPKYALAYAGLADAYFMQCWWGWSPQSGGFLMAKECANKAIGLDKNNSEAHATMGAILSWNDWNWELAEKEFTLALELNPNNAAAHRYYSELLNITDRSELARKHINDALMLDPFSPVSCLLSSLYYYHEGKLDKALEECRKTEGLDTPVLLTCWRYFDIYYRSGEDLKVIETLKTILSIDPVSSSGTSVITEVYKKSRLRGLLNWVIGLETTKSDPDPLALAKWNAWLGKKGEAIQWLNRALDNRFPGLPKINIDPDFVTLRNEPEFKFILKQLKLPNSASLPVVGAHMGN